MPDIDFGISGSARAGGRVRQFARRQQEKDDAEDDLPPGDGVGGCAVGGGVGPVGGGVGDAADDGDLQVIRTG